jgi:hypothetical protein
MPLSHKAGYALEGNTIFTYPVKQDVTHPSDLLSFLKVMAIFYSVMAIPLSSVLFTLKAAEFSVSVLQFSQHCYKF